MEFLLFRIPAGFRLMLVGCAALALAMGVGRFSYTPLLTMMMAEGAITLADGGFVASVHFLGYLMGALMALRLPLPPRLALRLALLGVGFSTVAMGFDVGLAATMLLRWIAGVASAWVLILVSNFLVRRLADRGRPAAAGVVFAGVGGGIALMGLACLALMAGGIDSATSWRFTGAVSLCTAFALCLGVGEEFPATRPARRDERTGRRPLSRTMVLAYGMAGLGYVVPATYLPSMARAAVSDPLVFGWSWPVFGIAALLSTLLSAALRRHYTDRSIWIAAQLVLAAGLVLPVLVPDIAGVAVSGLLVGGTFMVITMAGMQEAHRVAPADDLLRHIAAMTTAFAAGQIAGPFLAASMHLATGSLAPVLGGTAAALLLSAALLLRGARSKEFARP